MTIEQLQKLPKIELHCHLDGSLSKKFIQERLGRPVADEELCVSQDCTSLLEYLEKFELPLQCLTDEEGFEGAGYDVMKTMAQEQVCYAEIRFAPLLSVKTGRTEAEQLDSKQVTAALIKGLERGRREFGIDYGVIVCAMRHHSIEDNYEMIKAASQFLGKGVCAADLAGAEAQYPMRQFMELFERVKELGMPFTIHAGECGNAENIADALKAGAARIGHGIAMRGNPKLQKMAADAQTGIEMCPVSNLQTKASKCAAEYPLREFLDAGLCVTVNTDNRTVSGTSMTNELAFIQKTYGIRDDEIMLLMENAVCAAFADEAVKERLRRKLEEFKLTGSKNGML